jgi:hypothetical protein
METARPVPVNDIGQICKHLQMSYTLQVSLKLWHTAQMKLWQLALAYANTSFVVTKLLFQKCYKNASVVNLIYNGPLVFSLL